MPKRDNSIRSRLILIASASLALLSASSCASPGGEIESTLITSAIGNCGIAGFTLSPSEHIVNEINEPFVVRRIQGRIDSAGGEWPDDWPILFEIRGIQNIAKIRGVHADGKGVFKMDHVKEGRYCFKATVNGWQSVVGIIIVNRKADPKSKITFVMELGVKPKNAGL
jgi:hypothetical protein